jgi:riboflavin synthase
MFTGIVEEVGRLGAIRRGAKSARLTVSAPIVCQRTRIGDSIAISGVCLTVVQIDGPNLSFDAIPETIARTSLKAVRIGNGVNLERAMLLDGRFGGHLVQGHVDGTGTLIAARQEENARILRIGAPSDLMRYVIPKGSVTLDGISLTVVETGQDWFTVAIIPHTWSNTTLCERRIGDPLNIENDVIARYLEKLLDARGLGSTGITPGKLSAAGFAE